MNRYKLLLVVLSTVQGIDCLPQAGTLDDSFGGGGIVTTTFGDQFTFGRAVAVQADGKVIVAGSSLQGTSDFTLVRFLQNGDPDPGFGTNGVVATDLSNAGPDQCYALLIQPDGKIVAAGSASSGGDFALARYQADGSLDAGFGNNGGVVFPVGDGATYINDLALQPDGKILATGRAYIDGWYDFALARLNQDGTLDQSFGANGIVTATMENQDDARALAMQADGKILVAGSTHIFLDADDGDFALLRFNADGTPDTSFGTGGQQRTALSIYGDFADAVNVLPGGAILVSGRSTSGGLQIAMARYFENGSLDVSFGSDGIVMTPLSGYLGEKRSGAVVQIDGKILVAASTIVMGNGVGFALARYHMDGSPDLTFDVDGLVTTQTDVTLSYGTVISLAPDNRIIIAGSVADGFGANEMIVARYLNDLDIGLGSLDPLDHVERVFPDPVGDIAMFSFTVDRAGTRSLAIHDVAGRSVRNVFSDMKYDTGEYSEMVDFSGLAAGNYTLVLRSVAGTVSMNVVKQ